MMRFVMLILLAGCAPAVLGQKRIDSLRQIIEKSSGSDKVDALNIFAYEAATDDSVEAAKALNQAYELSRTINYKKGEALAVLYMGFNQYSAGNIPSSDKLIFVSTRISHQINDSELEGYGYSCLSANYQDLGLLDSAKYFSDKALKLLKPGDNPFYLTFFYNSRADYYKLLGRRDSQLFYIRKSWVVRKTMPDKFYLVYAGKRLSDFYTKYQQYNLALAYLDSSQHVLGADTTLNIAIASIWATKANVYTQLSNYRLATYFFDKAKKYYSNNRFPGELVKLLIEITELYENIGNYEAALKSAFDALLIAEQNNFSLYRTKCLIRVGWGYFNLRQFALSEKYTRQAIDLSIQTHQTPDQASAYHLYGQILNEKRSLDARSYFMRSMAIRVKNNDIPGWAEDCSNLGEYYYQQKNYDSALFYHRLSLDLTSRAHYLIGKAYATARVGLTYIAINDFHNAAAYLDKSEKLADSIKSGTVMLEVLKYRKELAQRLNRWQDYVRYTHLYEALSDSLFNSSVNNRVSIIENMYELQRRNSEIELQKAKVRSQDEDIRIKKFQITSLGIGGALILLTALAFSINYYKTRKLNLKIIEQNNDLATTKGEIQLQNDELLVRNEKIQSQRDLIERQRNDLDQKNDELKILVKKRTKELVQYIQQLEQFTFISSHNLRAPAARILGLGNLLEMKGINSADSEIIHKSLISTAKELDRVITDLNLILETRKKSDLILTPVSIPDAIQTIRVSLQSEIANNKAIILEDFSGGSHLRTFPPYFNSILLNLISNAIKYRRPNLSPVIEIKTISKNHYLCIKVTDNGLGIDLKTHGEKVFTLYKRFHNHVEGKGLGLYMVKTQMISMGGKIKIKSEVNAGTTIYLYFKKESTPTLV